MSKGQHGPTIEKNGKMITLGKDQIEAQLKKLRMKEYYKNRVKTDFAPQLSDSYDSEDDGSGEELTMEKKKKRARRAKVAIEDRKGWNNVFWADKLHKKKGKKPKYLKQSDRVVKTGNENPFNKRARSVLEADPMNPAVERYGALPQIDIKLSDRLWNQYTSKALSKVSGMLSPQVHGSKTTLMINSNDRLKPNYN